MLEDFTIDLRGRRYRVEFVSSSQLGQGDWDGDCDSPTSHKKRIRVRKDIKSKRRLLEVLVHEVIHALNWDKDEQAVVEESAAVAATLWKAGFRYVEDS